MGLLDTLMIKPEVNRYYQHRYGGLYLVKDIATSSVDKSKWVVYAHVYPFDYEIWIRPYNEWCDGRFTELSPGEYVELISTKGKDREAWQIEIGKARASKG